MVSKFIRKLRHGAPLNAADEAMLGRLGQVFRAFHARADIVCEGDAPRQLPVILEGWACRYRILDDGRRQIITLYVPGDLCEPFGTLPHLTAHPIMALTPVTIMPVNLEALQTASRSSRRIEMALWWDLLVSMATEREQIVSIGARSAVERMAHLLCELYYRLDLVGDVEEQSFDFPLTQAEIGEAVGLSTVHVNRTLQELRRRGLLISHGQRITIPHLEAIMNLASFDPAYLHLDGVVIAEQLSERANG